MTCQSPLAARAFAAFKPRPEEAPVMMTVGFCEALSVVAMAAGAIGATVAAAAATRIPVAARALATARVDLVAVERKDAAAEGEERRRAAFAVASV